MKRPLSKSMIALGVLLGAVLACTLGVIVVSQFGMRNVIGNDPGKAKKIAQSVLDYSLPEGYLEQAGINLGILQMVYLTPGGQEPSFHERNIILMVAIPPDSTIPDDDVRLELQTNLLRASDEVSTMEFIREDSATVRGEPISLKVFESFGQYDPPTRMVYTSVFPGKSANVMLAFAGPIEGWDQRSIDQFLASIK